MAVSKKDLQCTIGKNIKVARNACGYTQEILAEKAGISVEHITQVERGSKMMSVHRLLRVADALHVSIDTLVSVLAFSLKNVSDKTVAKTGIPCSTAYSYSNCV